MPRGKVEIDCERCKGCGLCVEACPQDILDLSGNINSSGYEYVEVTNPGECVGCAFCGISCPDVAITVYKEKAEVVS